MAYLIEFKTALFDPAVEPPNPINPIAGQSILVWIRDNVLPEANEPDYEDWGWYTEVDFQGLRYLIGGICFAPEEGSAESTLDWMVQVHKHQSLMDKLLGRNKIQASDALAAKIASAIRAQPRFTDVRESTDA